MRGDGRGATVRDVAEAAGVSVSTVSLVLNNPGRVAEPTRTRVLDAIDRLEFVPRADAVARARRAARRVGVIGPFSTHPAAAQRLVGVLAGSTETTDVVAFDVPSAADSTEPLLASLPRSGRLDGLLVVSLPVDDALLDRCRALGLPVVLVDSRHPGTDDIHTDDASGGRLAAEHLLARGHRRLGFFGEASVSDRHVSPGHHRLAGYRDAAMAAGATLAEEHVVLTPRGSQPADAVHQLLQGPDRPTAVFAADDDLAATVLKAARHTSLRVPDDLAVIGYDDGKLADALDLTTIAQPLRETGTAALHLLQTRLETPGPARSVTMSLELRLRGTT